MKIEEILRHKGRHVVTIPESRSVLDAVQVLVDHHIGAVVVTRNEHPVGIFTERDILRLTAKRPGSLETTQVGDAMTQDVITASPEDQLLQIMDVMTENKVRHLPIMDGDSLVGIVSIGDLLNACRIEAENENSQLRQYIQGVG